MILSKLSVTAPCSADTVRRFDENATLKIDGAIDSADVEGNNVRFNVGSGSIVLKGMAGRTINIADSDDAIIQTVLGNILVGSEDIDTLSSAVNGQIFKPLDGNDVVSLTGSKQIVEYVKGNDTVYGIDDGDTIRFDNNYWATPTAVGNDIV